jgi:hypothetical protein
MSNPYMCGASMGMVFCDPPFTANGGTGFSLIFKSWVIHDTRSYVAALVGVFALGVARQALVTLRGALVGANSRGARRAADDALLPAAGAGGGGKFARALRVEALAARPAALLAVETALFAAALGLAYINMLVAMVYDAGLLAALVGGEALAFAAARVACGDDAPEPAASCCE